VLLQKCLSTAYIAKFIELYVVKWRLFRYDHYKPRRSVVYLSIHAYEQAAFIELTSCMDK